MKSWDHIMCMNVEIQIVLIIARAHYLLHMNGIYMIHKKYGGFNR